MSNYRALVLTGTEPPMSGRANPVRAQGDSGEFLDFTDPRLIEFLRLGHESASGVVVSVEAALRNPAMFRAVSLISYAIGMLPFQLIDSETKEQATDHPLYRLLHREPNNFQTAFDFRTLMQLRALVKGDAYAVIVRGFQVRTGRNEIIRLIPLDTDQVTASQGADWSVTYKYQPSTGAARIFRSDEIFHLRGLSLNGINGLSLVKQAREALGLALAAELGAGKLFKNGSFLDGYLKTPNGLSDQAFARLKADWNDRYSGLANAGKTPILEEGTEYAAVGQTARDAQLMELRRMQVEEVGRFTGVPRPLLMVDETSWGSGIGALGQFFVQYALNPWFTAWEQGIERSCLASDEKGRLSAKYNAAALMNGSTKDQAEFFAKALGAGGQPGWMSPNQIRRISDMPDDPHPSSNEIPRGTSASTPPPASNDNGG